MLALWTGEAKTFDSLNEHSSLDYTGVPSRIICDIAIVTSSCYRQLYLMFRFSGILDVLPGATLMHQLCALMFQRLSDHVLRSLRQAVVGSGMRSLASAPTRALDHHTEALQTSFDRANSLMISS